MKRTIENPIAINLLKLDLLNAMGIWLDGRLVDRALLEAECQLLSASICHIAHGIVVLHKQPNWC
jgi:hypothetical protein